MSSKRDRIVLDQLDEQTDGLRMDFPQFGCGFNYVDSRLHVFANFSHWGIIIQAVEVNPNSIGHDRILNVIYRFGDHLIRPLGLGDNQFAPFTADSEDGPTFGEYKYFDGDHLNPDIQMMKLRGHLVPVPHDLQIYERKGIKLVDPKKIYPQELLRALTPEYRECFFLNENELQKEFRDPIPLLMHLDEWRHPLVLDDNVLEKPSQCETFQLIAKVIATCDPNEYRPTEKPNTHWSKWLIADQYL
jgi:hypothetical protein